MSLTPSTMLPLGTTAPEFKLLDTVSKQRKSLNELKGRAGTLVMFICNHCPFVIHIEKALAELGARYQDSDISIVAISSNNVETHPQDGPEHMSRKANTLGWCFPYLYDETQSVAKSYHAACTPDFFLFDAELKCIYRGQFDDSRPGNNLPVSGKDIYSAIENLLEGAPLSNDQKASIGCNIKWK